MHDRSDDVVVYQVQVERVSERGNNQEKGHSRVRERSKPQEQSKVKSKIQDRLVQTTHGQPAQRQKQDSKYRTLVVCGNKTTTNQQLNNKAMDDQNNITPTTRDVLNGRGQGVQRHPGNVKYRKLVFVNKVRAVHSFGSHIHQ
jgi:hypothetical protein